jgi:flagellar hook-basal body complex protein FliE
MVPVTQAAMSIFGGSLGAAAESSASTLPFSTAIAAGDALSPIGGGSAVPSAPFADLLTEAVGEVQHLEQQASVAIKGLISGRGVDVHEAMIAAQKAGMGFELVLAVRNKALAAYQQVIGMQF